MGSMDPETERHLASILLQEATAMRQQADKEGVHVYLRPPQHRNRPNSRFLAATVIGVQQANRVVEVNEMWRIREKELELSDRSRRSETKSRSSGSSSHSRGKHHLDDHSHISEEKANRKRLSDFGLDPCTSNSHETDDNGFSPGEGSTLGDNELEEFLRSRIKRGRGSVGSRMDEPGPYLPSSSSHDAEKPSVPPDARLKEDWEHRLLGPARPGWMKKLPQDEDDLVHSEPRRKSEKKHGHSEKAKTKKKKKKKDEKSKRH